MTTFAYRARKDGGEIVEGCHEAPSQNEALQFLRQNGLAVTHVRTLGVNSAHAVVQEAPPSQTVSLEVGSTETVSPPAPRAPAFVAEAPTLPVVGKNSQTPKADLWANASSKDLSLYFRQLHTMANAGMGISRALKILSENATNAQLRRASHEMNLHTNAGGVMSAAMRRYPVLFKTLAVSMLEAGERGGFVETVFLRLADYYEHDFQLQQAIRREAFYPKILAFCAFFIPSVVTLVLNGLSAWLAQITPIVILIVIGFVVWKMGKRVLALSSTTPSLVLWIDTIKLMIPSFGKTTRAVATSQFCRALATLYSSGVGARHAYELSGAASGNAYLAQETARSAPLLEQGASFTELMTRTRLFSPLALQMMVIGEETGDIDKQLNKTADFLESEAEAAIKQNVKIMGVLIFALVACYIAYIVISMYTGYAGEIGKLID